jgi:hypothetical protein
LVGVTFDDVRPVRPTVPGGPAEGQVRSAAVRAQPAGCRSAADIEVRKMSNLTLVKNAYTALFLSASPPTQTQVENDLAPNVTLTDHDTGATHSGRNDVAAYLLGLVGQVKKQPDATFKEEGGVVFCLDHMTKPNAGSCVDRVTVGPSGTITDIQICYLQGK